MKFDPETNFYAILQVDEAACGPVVLAAYKTLQEQYMDEPRRRALLDQAYNVLSHPTQRKQFDAFRESIKGTRDDTPEVVVLCPVCQSKNVLNPLKDNRAAICGICRAKISKDLIGKPIRQQARKNILSIFKRKYAGIARQYRSQLVYGLILVTVGAIGTGTFFGFRSHWQVGNYRLVMPQQGQAGQAGQASVQGGGGQAQTGAAPVQRGQRLNEALGALKRGGWAVASQYDVAGRGGKQRIVEASNGASRVRLYFKAGRLIESESF